jgi:plastocyanin
MSGSNSYSPSTATVQVGQQVRWRNDDNLPHTATRSGTGAFDTGTLNPGQTSSPITMSTPGMLGYVCTIHPAMTGNVNVTN